MHIMLDSRCRPSKSDQNIRITCTSRYIIGLVFFMFDLYSTISRIQYPWFSYFRGNWRSKSVESPSSVSKEPRSTAVIPRREPGMRVLDLVYEPGVHLSILERGPGAVGGELARPVFVPVAEGLWTDWWVRLGGVAVGKCLGPAIMHAKNGPMLDHHACSRRAGGHHPGGIFFWNPVLKSTDFYNVFGIFYIIFI